MFAERLRKGTDKRKEERDSKERAKREAEEKIKAEQRHQAYAETSHRTIKFSDAICAVMCSSSGEDSFSMGGAPAAPSAAQSAGLMKLGASFKAKLRERSLSSELDALKNKNKPSERAGASAGGFGTVGATVLGSVLFKGLASSSEPAPNFEA
jgi:hypothetical protein